jgi:hypothetical protein
MTSSLVLQLLMKALVRPSRALDLLTMWWAFRKSGSVRMAKPYLVWRLHTYHGEEHHAPTADEILGFAKWRREMEILTERR